MVSGRPLRGDYKQSEYRKVILPFTVLRRLDCVMAPTRKADSAKNAAVKVENRDAILYRRRGLQIYNLSRRTSPPSAPTPANVTRNLINYYNGFSASAREILDKYDFHRRSRGFIPPGCCTRSCSASPTSTSARPKSITTRWATSSRS